MFSEIVEKNYAWENNNDNYAEIYGMRQRNFNSIYNVNSKIQFVEDYYNFQNIDKKVSAIRFFKSIGTVENQKNKDVNLFNLPEIVDLLKGHRVFNVNSYHDRMDILKQYFRWSISQGLINSKSTEILESITDDVILGNNTILMTYFKDFKDLSQCYNEIVNLHNYVDIHQYDMYKVIFCLAWTGLSLQEAHVLKIENINFKEYEICINDKHFPIDNEIANIINSFIILEGYSDKRKTFIYQKSEYILKRLRYISDTQYTIKDLRSRLNGFSNILKKNVNQSTRHYQHSFSYDNIRQSGKYYKIHQFENDYDIVFSKESLPDFHKALEKLYINAENEYKLLISYRKWKNVFMIDNHNNKKQA